MYEEIEFSNNAIFGEVEARVKEQSTFMVFVSSESSHYTASKCILRLHSGHENFGAIKTAWYTLRTGNLMAAICHAQSEGYVVSYCAGQNILNIFFSRPTSQATTPRNAVQIPDLNRVAQLKGN